MTTILIVLWSVTFILIIFTIATWVKIGLIRKRFRDSEKKQVPMVLPQNGAFPNLGDPLWVKEDQIRRIKALHPFFLKVVRMTTGEAFKVSTRNMVDKGIREQELDQYPKWED